MARDGSTEPPLTECHVPISPCASIQTFTYNYTYSHPLYPSCNITVPLKVFICYNQFGIPKAVTFEILGDFETWTYSIGCNALKTHWNNLYQTNQIGQLETELVNLYNDISNFIETDYMEAFLFTFQIYCPSLAMESNFVKRSCTSFCFGDRGEGGFGIYQPACGEACCVRRKDVCLKPDGSLNVSYSNIYQQGSCLDSAPDCQPGEKSSGICRIGCRFL